MTTRSVSVIIEVFQETPADEHEITVPLTIYKQINKKTYTKLKVGAAEADVTCSPNNTKRSILVSKKLVDILGLYSFLQTNVIINDNKICLGPVVAFFTETAGIYYAKLQTPGYKMWATTQANKNANTILYHFSINDVDVNEQRIKGTYYNYRSDRWEQRLFPFPDVLNDRGGGVLKSQLTATEQIRQVLYNNENVKRLNPKYIFDKFEIHEKLSKYEDIAPHLPATILYEKPGDLLKMFEKFPVLYIKDSYGNRGLGVARASKLSEGRFELSYVHNKIYKYKLENFRGLLRKLNILFKNKKTIIQSAIDVIKVNKGNVDLRATVQRNGDGELEIVAYPVRLGKEGAPITSTRSGSEVYKFEDFFKEFLNYSPTQITKLMRQIDKFLIACYEAIEDLYGKFGEIGIDFAVDSQGEIWFIECNAKPGKNTVYQSYDDETIKKAFLNPLEYAKYLIGF